MYEDGLGFPEDLSSYLGSIWSMDRVFELPDLSALRLDRSDDPFVLWIPAPRNSLLRKPFNTATEWREFVLSHDLNPAIPKKIAEKFQLALKVYFLAWIDGELIKAAELVALSALELALKSRYGSEMQQKKIGEIIEKEKNAKKLSGKRKKNPTVPQLNELLEYMVGSDGLTNDKIPMAQKYGSQIINNIYETKADREARRNMLASKRMVLSEIRNSLAHGNAYDCMPWSGLLELVRDLIEYAYRDWPKSR